MTCTSSEGAKFGYNSTLGIRDGSCVRSASEYADPTDPMGVNVRHYSGFSKHIAGFLGNITILRALSGGGNKVHKYRVYSSSVAGPQTNNPVPGEPERLSTQLIKFINDRVVVGKRGVQGGTYWIEFKDERGFNDPKITGQEPVIGKGIVVQFRPAWPLPRFGTVQTVVADRWPVIKEGQEWLLDEHSGLTIEVLTVTDTYADVNMQWR